MGNCVMRNRSILGQNEKENHPREAEAIERRRDVHGGKTKKTVRFRFNEEDDADKERNGYSKNWAVRIRVVVTQRELIQILSESKYSCVEQLLKTMKLKTRKISHVRTSDERTNRGMRRPALESISEDR